MAHDLCLGLQPLRRDRAGAAYQAVRLGEGKGGLIFLNDMLNGLLFVSIAVVIARQDPFDL
jgi:hypothetical protein